MKESEIRKLIKLVEESDISELEVSRWGKKVKICKYPSAVSSSVFSQKSEEEGQTIILPPKREQGKEQSETPQEQLHQIKSPMVGTFYRSPTPDAETYIKKGERVAVGQVVCIIEAMKIMNEIESDIQGTIMDIPVDNVVPVEYGQTLFLVKPD